MNSSVSGVVVDAGEGGTSIIPVVCVCCASECEAEGYVLGAAVKTLPVNKLRTEQLQRHPYISFTQAKALYELRRRRIHLDSAADLQRLDCFTEKELQRVLPYLSFER